MVVVLNNFMCIISYQMYYKAGALAVIFTWDASFRLESGLSFPRPFSYGNITEKRPYLETDFHTGKE